MRPHRLSFTGIGPYPSAVEINFDELTTLGLYLIVGPTGAGKTTIFDAITYSLFGKLAGARSSQPIISDHDSAAPPLVELEFTHKGRRYTVTRKPSPPGKSTRPTDHVLRAHASEDDPASEDHKVTGATRVTDQIGAILGLDASQFNRVMLLPQNEFQQFLLANSSDKEKLLRSLFDTDLFHRTEEELERVARDLSSEAEEAGRELDSTNRQVAAERNRLIEAGLLPDQDSADPDSADQDSAESPHDGPTDISVEQVCAEVAALHQTALSTHEALTATAEAATEARITADGELIRYSAYSELTELRATAHELDPVLRHDEDLLLAHTAALSLTHEITQRDHAAHLVTEAQQSLADARSTASSQISPLASLHPLVAQFHHSSHHGLPAAVATAFTNLTTAVGASVQRHADAHSARQRAAACRVRHAETTALLLTRTELLHLTEKNLESIQERLEVAQAATLNLGDLRSAVEDLKRQELAADLSAPLTAVEEAQAQLHSANSTAQKAQADLHRGVMARTQFLAGELAQALSQGDPCPVCGSKEHPSLAPLSPDAPDNIRLAELRDQAHDQRLRAEAELNRRLDALAAAQRAADQLAPPEQRDRLRAEYLQAEDARKDIPELTAQARDLSERLTTVRTDIAELGSEADGAVSEAHQADKEASENSERAEIAEDHLPRITALLNELAGFEEMVQTLVDRLAHYAPLEKGASERVSQMLESSTFPDEETALAAVLEDATHHIITERAQLARARDQRITHLEGVIGDRPVPDIAPDLEALQAAESDLRSQVTAAGKAATQLDDSHNRLTAIARALDELGPTVAVKHARAARFRDIVTIMRHGKMPHFALERWVQRAIFEDVCQVASERIKVLSAGRYLLTLNPQDGRAKAHAAGLDLYVTDSHTGRTRPVQTLSGGEQFLTSLALALALADVVQQMSGGMELASLFIDEGFGSLDGETLDTAVDVLRSLQDSGRSVGVISHVEAMQNDLPVGIRVSPAPTGSSITFPALNKN